MRLQGKTLAQTKLVSGIAFPWRGCDELRREGWRKSIWEDMRRMKENEAWGGDNIPGGNAQKCFIDCPLIIHN
jgi:hypothetical protein